MTTVVLYRDKDNRSQIEDLLLELQEKSRSSKSDRIRLEAILFCIDMLREKGLNIREPYAKKIIGQPDLYELRPRSDRVFFFSQTRDTLVLLHSFVKKSQKTPDKEIEQAVREKKDYLERMMNNEK